MCKSSRQTKKVGRPRAKHPIKSDRIAVLDMETDPFDGKSSIKPFCCEIYSEHFEPVVIWDENFDEFADSVYSTIENLPGKYTIYAHNGGRFDWLFLVKLLRGKVSFKGRAIMSAKIGRHEIRDSYHIIPTKLAAYRKDDFDYSFLLPENRNKKRAEILDYLHHDCVYQYEIVKDFIQKFGKVLSIGQAAFKRVKSLKQIENLGEVTDQFFRDYFYGGRVECLRGAGHFDQQFKLYDVNSMYPFVMAEYSHPLGCETLHSTKISENTFFLDIECDNFGALVARDENGSLTTNIERGIFKTTIHEYKTALELGLIENVKIHKTIDFYLHDNFADFVTPLYQSRQKTKTELKNCEPESARYFELKREDLFYKLLLNNCYGKFAQNPRKFKDHFYTDYNDHPNGQLINEFQVMDENSNIWQLSEESRDFDHPEKSFKVWSMPVKFLRFNNVATAASITGAARSVLMRGIKSAINPIYCDTDSIICEHLNLELNNSKLGAWSIDAEMDEAIIAGKKLYGYRKNDAVTIKAKGAKGLSWNNLNKIIDNIPQINVNTAPTIKKTGEQQYISRKIQLTTSKNYKSRIFLK